VSSITSRGATLWLEPGSFRDPDSRVFTSPDGVLRAVSDAGLADWRRLRDSGLYEELARDGRLVATEELPAGELPQEIAGGWAGGLRHARVPFVSYPYEWPFGMLKDAARLQLELLDAALARDLILKDSSPYNVQFRGVRPTFIDVGSFEPLRAGEPWIGYRQFCMLFLFPLMLRAYRDVPFRPWLRGSLEGITPGEMRNLLSVRDRFRRGVLSHVVLHARMERRYADRSRDVQTELKKAGFRKELIVANVRKLHGLVGRLRWSPDPSGVWVDYGETNTYTEREAEQKARFVAGAAATRRWERVWDLGCNDGRFSRIAAEHADHVVAIDGDEGVVEVLYERLRDEGREDILPLVVDLTDPSPARGWRGRERQTLEERGAPDLVLALALIHHVAITGNVPIPAFVDWLRSLGAALVIELPLPDDPMVVRLLSGKRPGLHGDYTREHFERCLRTAFDIERSEDLAAGTRVLYFARPRAGPG
jgi:SAM-dependent methyltransferase